MTGGTWKLFLTYPSVIRDGSSALLYVCSDLRSQGCSLILVSSRDFIAKDRRWSNCPRRTVLDRASGEKSLDLS